jgi:hypothetical protein
MESLYRRQELDIQGIVNFIILDEPEVMLSL